eukprot:CAMPEP_0196653706 /NCGR_PEP_ID=MMETSP1086-20130531/3349_1 /TAXON_ID=77921 /ORGANISM="Cyanoptyche  gloeocystis , Strain SAG4.97" /LENGTH=78 /DNA_ID=CAMNT_0041985029 /DNA_START=92 /DNA_END=328 /DNA_ORIENTATION=-
MDAYGTLAFPMSSAALAALPVVFAMAGKMTPRQKSPDFKSKVPNRDVNTLPKSGRGAQDMAKDSSLGDILRKVPRKQG